MVIEITQTTLKRLDNYQAVVQRDHQDAHPRQWRVMTLKVMQAAEQARARANHVASAVAYAHYLYQLQTGQARSRFVYGEPLLSQALSALLTELSVAQRMVETESAAFMSGE